MRLCLVGNYRGSPNEGQANVSFYLNRELSQRHQVLLLSVHDILLPRFWLSARQFRPQVIHYVPGPSLKSFLITRALALCCPGAKTVMSAIHPTFSPFSKKLVPWLKPDLVLTQSPDTEQLFRDLGCRTGFMPSGVDAERFVPVPPEAKRSLRARYGLSESQFVILHVGAIKMGRNISLLGQLQGNGNQTIVIGRRSTAIEGELKQTLERRGCWVWTRDFDNIQEIYGLADCYVFPTFNRKHSIEIPLSVLEAMSCNLPVISAKFGGLPRLFPGENGLYYAEKDEDFAPLLEKLKTDGMKVSTREKISPYTWRNVAQGLEQVYSELLGACPEGKP